MSKLSFPIILEGNECNYKTTIARKLQAHYGMDIVKGNSFEIAKMPMNEMVKYLTDIIEGEPVIIDRFIYSNLVYANLYSGYTLLSDWHRNCIEEAMKSKSAIVVHLNAPTGVLENRINLRGDDMVSLDMLGIINSKFHEEIIKANLRNVHIVNLSTDGYTSDEIVDALIYALNYIESCL